MSISPFCVPSVEIVGRRNETLSLNNSRPGVGANTTPPPMPSTGTAVNLVPSDSANLIGEIMDTAGQKRFDETVIAADSDQHITK